MTIIKSMCDAILGVFSRLFNSIRSLLGMPVNEGYQVIDSPSSSQIRTGTSLTPDTRSPIHEPHKGSQDNEGYTTPQIKLEPVRQKTQISKVPENQDITNKDKKEGRDTFTTVSESQELLFRTKSTISDEKITASISNTPGLALHIPIDTGDRDNETTDQTRGLFISTEDSNQSVTDFKIDSVKSDENLSNKYASDDVSKINFLKNESIPSKISEATGDRNVDDTVVPQSITEVFETTPEIIPDKDIRATSFNQGLVEEGPVEETKNKLTRVRSEKISNLASRIGNIPTRPFSGRMSDIRAAKKAEESSEENIKTEPKVDTSVTQKLSETHQVTSILKDRLKISNKNRRPPSRIVSQTKSDRQADLDKHSEEEEDESLIQENPGSSSASTQEQSTLSSGMPSELRLDDTKSADSSSLQDSQNASNVEETQSREFLKSEDDLNKKQSTLSSSMSSDLRLNDTKSADSSSLQDSQNKSTVKESQNQEIFKNEDDLTKETSTLFSSIPSDLRNNDTKSADSFSLQDSQNTSTVEETQSQEFFKSEEDLTKRNEEKGNEDASNILSGEDFLSLEDLKIEKE